ncbi:hypothetical protein [Streptomyces viridosporus]|uniref:hypothetical protein n=1 Tax=Streptomyces viridosporus TaxID=67581 RepID=UPI0036F67602
MPVKLPLQVLVVGAGTAVESEEQFEQVPDAVGGVQASGEALGTLPEDPGCADRIMAVLVDELAAPTADSATRIRPAQALVELSGPTVREVLRRPAYDDDSTVTLVATAFVTVLDERSPEDRGDEES